MRTYEHDPDEPFLSTQLETVTRRIERAAPKVAQKLEQGRLDLYPTTVDSAFERATLLWALDAPIAEVVAAVGTATGWIGTALARGYVPDANTVDRWLQIVLVGGDGPSASMLATQVTAGIPGFDDRGPATRWYIHGLLALLREDADGATAAADSLHGWLEAPATSPRELAAYGELHGMLEAAASASQSGFLGAASLRAARRATVFGASVELRRHPDGLIDRAAAAVVRMAAVRGLAPPDDQPSLAGELITAVPWSPPRADG